MNTDLISIGALIIIVVALAVAIWIDRAARGVERGILRELRSLQEEWPFFSALALEWRVRSFCEAYFTRFRKGEREEILAHCTPKLFQFLSPRPNAPPVPEFDSPGEVLGIVGPNPFQILAPSNDRPPTVEMLLGINFADRRKKEGFCERRYLFVLTYQQSGNWLVDDIVEADLSIRDAPPGELDTTWLRSNTIARASQETLHPERPRTKNGGKFDLLSFTACVFSLLGIALAILSIVSGWRWEKKNTRLREDGNRIQATVVSHEYNENYRKFRFRYSFRPPGWDRSFVNQTSLMKADHAEVDVRAGEASVASGQIEVAYDPGDPSINCAVAKTDPTARGVGDMAGVDFVIVSGLASTIYFGRSFLSMHRKDCSPFWFHWSRRARAHRRQSLPPGMFHNRMGREG